MNLTEHDRRHRIVNEVHAAATLAASRGTYRPVSPASDRWILDHTDVFHELVAIEARRLGQIEKALGNVMRDLAAI